MKKLLMFILLFSLLGCLACNQGANENNGEKPPDTPENETPAVDPMQLFDARMNADAALAVAKRARVLVMENVEVTSGKDVWNEFYSLTQAGKSASVLIAQYYTLDQERVDPALYAKEKHNYPVLYFSLLSYDGECFDIVTKNCHTGEQDSHSEYKYLLHFTGRLPDGAAYSKYDRYVLADDENVTWERLERGLLSSTFGDYIPHRTVYIDFFD